MANANEDANDNHWPGYVDALTTMLMVMTFVMMILGIAVFAMSQNVSRIIVETIARAALPETPPENMPVPELTELILDHLRRNPPRAPARTGEQAAGSAASQARSAPGAVGPGTTSDTRDQSQLGQDTRLLSSEQAFVPTAPVPVKTAQAGLALVIEFQQRATRLDEAATAELAQTLSDGVRFRDADIIEIRATVNRSAPSLTDARRIAYYRAMLVRTAVLQAGLPASRVRIFNDETAPEPGNTAFQEVVRVIPLSKPD